MTCNMLVEVALNKHLELPRSAWLTIKSHLHSHSPQRHYVEGHTFANSHSQVSIIDYHHQQTLNCIDLKPFQYPNHSREPILRSAKKLNGIATSNKDQWRAVAQTNSTGTRHASKSHFEDKIQKMWEQAFRYRPLHVVNIHEKLVCALQDRCCTHLDTS
jgi:hypothetical protein